MSKELAIKYSETFFSAQGEGKYTGIPSLWIRFFLCNLQCAGFGQANPADPSTYLPVGNDLDLTNIKSIHELPVFSVGCDSAYSVSKRYKHLITDRTVEVTVDELTALLPHKTFVHPATLQEAHMVFTGGEPMLPNTQSNMVAIMNEFKRRGNLPKYVTVETNGTKALSGELMEYIAGYVRDGGEWFWSVSPKLWSTAGEEPGRAIRPDLVHAYHAVSKQGQLKFVVNGSKASWDEVELHVRAFRAEGIDYPVYIMGVGGTLDGLKMTEAMIADEALQRGYYYTTRAHVHIWGNTIGK